MCARCCRWVRQGKETLNPKYYPLVPMEMLRVSCIQSRCTLGLQLQHCLHRHNVLRTHS